MTKPSASSARYWCVIPAAGIGSRAKSSIPKQYLRLGDKTIIEHTLEKLLQIESIQTIVVALHPQDSWWPTLEISTHPKIITVVGGDERHSSVTNALNSLAGYAEANDWVLVHDAARPCVRVADINQLIDLTVDHPVGGLLGAPVSDTIKRVEKNHSVAATVDREALWCALTPQIFRFDLLRQVLSEQYDSTDKITDESMAMEKAGYQPLMVEGSKDNIKITVPSDLQLATVILQSQGFSQLN